MTRSDFNTEDPFGRPVADRLTETQSTVNAALGHALEECAKGNPEPLRAYVHAIADRVFARLFAGDG